MNKSNRCCIPDAGLQQAVDMCRLGSELTATTITNRDQSKKFDSGKLRMELIPTTTLTSIGRVLTHGAEKYGPNTWQSVEYERYIGAILRHLVSFIEDPTGKDLDSGLLHIEHVLTNAAFLNDAVRKGRVPINEKP